MLKNKTYLSKQKDFKAIRLMGRQHFGMKNFEKHICFSKIAHESALHKEVKADPCAMLNCHNKYIDPL